ncbi:CE1 family esterase [Halovulum sp. GXIMD14793]
MRILLTLAFMILPLAATACGRTSDCRVGDSTYRLILPDGPVKGTLVLLHGWQGSSAILARSDRMVQAANRRGLALVYPNGALGAWAVPNSPAERLRDDFALLETIKADLVERQGLDPERILLAGFSMGGQMTWSVACGRGQMFSGYIAVAGAMWDPVPQDCADPAAVLIHIHGTADVNVPLEGKPYGRNHSMAPVEKALALRHKGCGVAERFRSGNLRCRRWTCNGVTESCLHDGAHDLYVRPLFRAWERIAIRKGWE